MSSARRSTWRNHTGNQSVQPLRRCRAESLADLVRYVREAEEEGCTVRAVGSGHSWSDVALTTGFLVETHDMARPLELDPATLRPAWRERVLVRVEAGMRIRELNEHLAKRGLALSNMGGYDGQTVAGVISTSTHGSGLGFGPLPDFVVSLDVVGAGGRVWRIEREDGPTDPAVYVAPPGGPELRADDRLFRASVVGLGCLGLIHSVVLEVEPAYWLKEVRRPATWEQARALMLDVDGMRAHRHFEVYFSPYEWGGKRPFLITTRTRTQAPRRGGGDHRRMRNRRTELMARLPGLPSLLNFAIDRWPRITPFLLDQAVRALVDAEFTHHSHRVLNIGAANFLPAYSSEIGVPLDGRHVEAIEEIFRIADDHRRIGSVYHTSPVALRFVQASDAYLSMMAGRDTMMIELIQMTRTEGGFELLAAYEEALYRLGGRPHWGQVNTLSADRRLLPRMYPELGEWLTVHDELNASGVFDSPFSRRVGLSTASFTP